MFTLALFTVAKIRKPLKSPLSDEWIKKMWGTSLVVQWLRFHAFTAADSGSIPGQGTKISHAMWSKKKKKKNKNENIIYQLKNNMGKVTIFKKTWCVLHIVYTHTHTHTLDYSAIKKNEIMPSAAHEWI